MGEGGRETIYIKHACPLIRLPSPPGTTPPHRPPPTWTLARGRIATPAELIHDIKSMEDEKELSGIAVEALHKASGSMKQLIHLLRQTALVWNQLKEHCLKTSYNIEYRLQQLQTAETSSLQVCGGWVGGRDEVT